MIGNKVKFFADQRSAPFYTFVEDFAASGGYWLLCQGDTSYAHSQSVIGSIGVVSQVATIKGLSEDIIKKDSRHVTTNEKLPATILSPYSDELVSDEKKQYIRGI